MLFYVIKLIFCERVNTNSIVERTGLSFVTSLSDVSF